MAGEAFPYASSPSAAKAAKRALQQQQLLQRAASGRRGGWHLSLLLVTLACIVLNLSSFASRYVTRTEAAAEARSPPEGAQTAPGSPTFTCADGRRGLHVVHTRFLLSQGHANATFIAARLMLMNTFFVASLSAQSAQSFALLVSHDGDLPTATRRALAQTLGRLRVAVLTQGERLTGRASNAATLSYAKLVAALAQRGALVEPEAGFDLYVTSRMDIDDAVHVRAVEGVQALACAGGATAADALRVSYVKPGLLWMPSAERSPYGVTTTVPGVHPFLAILQSMIKAPPLVRCALNVYSHQHTQPWRLQEMGADDPDPGCHFSFDRKRHLYVWAPPEGQHGSLYVRTLSSSTRDKDKVGGRNGRGADEVALAESFGVDAASLMTSNLFLSGLQDAAPQLLHGESANKFR